jgi:broad specificity phosphatase PhoE
MPRILLVRHGRSAHASTGWLDAAGVRGWLADYDVHGIAPDSMPPDALRAVARSVGIVVASDLPRAHHSAERLAGGAPVVTSPLLRETALPVPALGPVRLPLAGWALLIGVHAALRILRGAPPHADARAQGEAAAAWLAGLAERHGDVLAVTHGNVRGHIAAALGAAGWRRARGGRRFAHWSAWELARDAHGESSPSIQASADDARERVRRRRGP